MKNTEFKTKQFKDATVYTLESATSMGSGSIASVSSPMGGVRKRGDNLIAQEANTDKIDASKPRNFVAKNAKTGGAGAHKDKKKAEKQGDVKHKNKDMDMAEGKDDNIAQLKKDHDTAVHWSKNETSPQKREAARQKAEKIKRHLDTQYKQGVAEDDAGDVEQRFAAKMEKEKQRLAKLKQTDPAAYKREMEKRKTSSRIPPVSTFEAQGVAEAGMPFRGVGGAFNRGDDERHDLDPTDWYFVKDGKMFAISVYPRQEQEAIALGYSRTRDEAKAKAGKQGVAEGAGANKTEIAMAYLKAVVMAPVGTPEKRRILNWQQILDYKFDIEMDTATLAQLLPQLDSQLQSGKLNRLQKQMVSRGELEIGESQQGVAEGLPQTLRKVVPGYAKREIDKKMDAGKFGKTDADKDANFQRYKKIQDKLKEQGVAERMLPKSAFAGSDKNKLGPAAHAKGKQKGPVKQGQFVGGMEEEKQRLDPSCWKGYKKSGTKMKGGVRVNNCVPVSESVENIMDSLINKIITNEAIQNNRK